jgi:hypothetical protein
MRTEVSHALRGHPVRCDRANYYGMPTDLGSVLQAARTGRRIIALQRMARTPEVPKLPQHPVGPVATGPYQGRLGSRRSASVTRDDSGRDGRPRPPGMTWVAMADVGRGVGLRLCGDLAEQVKRDGLLPIWWLAE